jgi:hypothetical protein
MIGPTIREELGSQRRLDLARAARRATRHADAAQPPPARRAGSSLPALPPRRRPATA